jgi:L-threonylcarbamoyladenylate synthase
VRLPASDLARDIILRAGVPVAAPSANRSGCLSPTAAQHAYEDLAGRVGLIIDEGRCGIGVESTVVDVTGDVPVILRPGHITAEMIGRACGRMPVNAKKTQKGTPGAPGMKYRHYAPQAGVRVFSGDKKEVAKQVRELYDLCKEKRPVVFCASDCAALYGNMETVPLGSGAHEAEKRLFACLRDADARGHGIVLFHYTGEMGQAVKNRIDKAAETAKQDASGNMEVE